MSNKDKERDEFFDYLMALQERDTEDKFSPQFEEFKTDEEKRIEELEKQVKHLSHHVFDISRGPKGDKGRDGLDGEGFDLTEEDIKNAVRDGVVEGLQKFIGELKS